MQNLILVLDFGSKYTQIIARLVREVDVYSEILPYTASLSDIKAKGAKGIILAGTPEENALADKAIFELNVPVLHNFDLRLTETDEGKELFKSFAIETCAIIADWNAVNYIQKEVARIKDVVGNKRVLCGLSGGVDSSVTAALIHKAIGDRLVCVFVDTGLMRHNEGLLVEKAFKDEFKANLVYVNAEDRFLTALAGVEEPERKRKIIGELFIRVFEEEARKAGDFDFLAQGTIYPDIIESVSLKGTIKSHHNVGGLPADMNFTLLEPLRELFKDEVRKVGVELGLSKELVYRHPFPGPGIAVRILGEVTKERCDILRAADRIAIEELHKHNLYDAVWQAFCVLLPVRSVGVRDEKRTYENAAVFRAVNSTDAMTAEWVHLPYELLNIISTRIITEVKGINRMTYDISSKPPATIEWE